jgi:carbon monoxide dehydrogenase subunit G
VKLEQSFEVQAPLERVWQALIDVERVAPCLPGAEVTGRNEDGTYNGSFKVKIGPTAAAYTGKLKMENIDESAHRATMDAQGTDRRGQGGAKATIISAVAPAGGDATRVDVVTDYHITGRLARFGRGGMIEEISNRLLNEFARNLQSMLAQEPAPGVSPADVGPGAETPSTVIEGQAAVADTLEQPARESGEATVETLLEAAAQVAAAGDPSASASDDAAAVADQPAPLAADEPEGAPTDQHQPAGGAPAAAPEQSAQAAAESASAAAAAWESTPAAAAPAPARSPAPASEPTVPTSQDPGQSAWTPPSHESKPVNGLSLVASVMLKRVKSNPAPVVALLLGFLLALRVLRRR